MPKKSYTARNKKEFSDESKLILIYNLKMINLV